MNGILHGAIIGAAFGLGAWILGDLLDVTGRALRALELIDG